MQARSSTSSSSVSDSDAAGYNVSGSKWLALRMAAYVAVFVALLATVGVFFGDIYEEAAGKNKVNEWSRQRFEDFYASEQGSLDMLFMGSSHSYCTFDPENIDPILNSNSFQLGMPLQLPDATYYTLREALNSQQPATVVMELYWGVMDIDFDMKQADALFQVMHNEGLEDEYYTQVFPLKDKVKRGIKAIRFQQDYIAFKNKELLDYIDKEYGLKRVIQQFEGQEYYRSKGYIYCDYIMTGEVYDKIAASPSTDGRRWRMSGIQRGYIEDIARLCNDSNVKLVFVTAPVSNVAFRGMRHYDSIHKQVAALAEELGAPYLDFNIVNQEEKLFEDEHFRDANHLNDNGVQIAGAYFADWLRTLK